MKAERHPCHHVVIDQAPVVAEVLRQARFARMLIRRVAGRLAFIGVVGCQPQIVFDETRALVILAFH